MVIDQRLEEGRAGLSRAASPEVTTGAVGVCANFEMMNSILDATGCPISEHLQFVADLLG